MEDRKLVIGGFYRHFKNKLYQVRCIANHSETKEKLVIYQAMYGDFVVYARPYDMFMSEVDYEKYPNASQKYRFEQVNLDCIDDRTELKDNITLSNEKLSKSTKESDANEEEWEEREESVNPYLLLFLDAENYTEKLNVLSLCKDKLDDTVINSMAASMEIEVPDGPIEKRYTSLRDCIRTHVRYEGTRLR